MQTTGNSMLVKPWPYKCTLLHYYRLLGYHKHHTFTTQTLKKYFWDQIKIMAEVERLDMAE